jgi:acyl-homoserine-lactone acylase
MKDLMLLRISAFQTTCIALAAAAIVAACSDDDDVLPPPPPPPTILIERDARGVPHITAATPALAAQGLGDAYAQDNFCLLQDTMLTVAGERSRVFGPDAKPLDKDLPNLESDFFHRFVIDTTHARALIESEPAVLALMQGYAQGVNDYIARTPTEQIDPACVAYARTITLDDMARIHLDKMMRGGSGQFIGAIAAASPDGVQSAAAANAATSASMIANASDHAVPMRTLASNGWAFGRDVTSDGKALLFGNPHFPWTGADRFYEARLTVSGESDVSGVTLTGVPVIGLGYNKNVAWTHTVSTARRFTLHELTLKPGDRKTYIVDGAERALTPVSVSVPLPPDANGAPQSRQRTYYRSQYGPMLVLPALGLGWGDARAYALQDVNLDNNRALLTWSKMARVKTVRELKALLEQDRSIPYLNTIAADDTGEVLYADLGAVPKVENADIARCAPSPGAAALLGAASLVVLNGSDASCNWKAAGSTTSGLMPAERMPSVIRTDYVLNSNDSYWLTNPAYAFPADLSAILGPVGRRQGLRTRMALELVQQRLAGADGRPGTQISASDIMALWGRNDHQAARLVLDDLLAGACAQPGHDTVIDACNVLRAWDRTASLDARGAVLFREFWRRVAPLGQGIFAQPFDVADPARTPHGLKQDAASVAMHVSKLGEAAAALQTDGVALNASLREVQLARQGGREVPVPGADEFEGVLNKITPVLQNGKYVAVYGTSYVQLVSLGATPDTGASNANGFLAYSQSTDPRSPFFGNQIDAFSALQLQPLPDLR